MAFLRRKSGVYHEDIYHGDPEPQSQSHSQTQRRRLSKPLTNAYNSSSSSHLSSLPIQPLAARRSPSRPGRDTPATSSTNDSREFIRSYTYPSSSDLDLTKSKLRAAVGVLMATVSHETSTSTSQLSLVSPTLPMGSMSRMMSAKRAPDHRKTSISSLGSKDRYSADQDLGAVSPQSSSENLIQDLAPPARRASFTPGTATRVPIARKRLINQETEPVIRSAEQDVRSRVSLRRGSEAEDDCSWTPPPPPNDRSVTPADLEVSHIGRLGLGSLRVVNGTASPTPSEKSKRGSPFWQPVPIRRENSSVYPESEIGTIKLRKTVNNDWEGEPLPALAAYGSLKDKPDCSRTFSFNPGSEAKFNRGTSTPSVPTADQEDRASAMAQDYISGLPTSPFLESPPPMSPTSPSMDPNVHVEPPTSPRSPSATVTEPSTPAQAEAVPPHPPSAGSVQHHPDKTNVHRSFIDETLDSSPVTDRPISPASFFSVAEPDDELEAPFSSAVEFQPTRSRSRSPRKLAARPPNREAGNPSDGVHASKTDSGYSSNTSLGVLPPPVEQNNNADIERSTDKDKKRGLRFPFQKMQRSGKPVLVKPTPSTKVPSPKSARIETTSALTSTTSFPPTEPSTRNSIISLPSPTPKSKDGRRKLTKVRPKSTVEVARELVVQRLASVECFNVPPVPVTSKANLAQRSQTIPELDRTYRTQNHTATSANGSALSLVIAPQDVRFPSPTPEEEERPSRSLSRSLSRGRSFSRPRSWLGWPRRDKSGSRASSRDGEIIQTDLNDFGSVADLLGDNPYDIASRSRPSMPPSAWSNRPDFFRRRPSPSNISKNAPRPRTAMDDRTASTLSRLRRRSVTERDPGAENRWSFDERGSVPWTPSPPARSRTDVPPLPPMPSPEEINRRWSFRQRYTTHPTSPSPHENNQFSEPLSIDEPHEAPPPPPHSPRPMYVGDDIQRQYVTEPEQVFLDEEPPLPPRHSPRPSYLDDGRVFENAIDDEGPPPPSHSPRPLDVTPEPRPRDVSWSSQVNAWKVRRQSAGEALRKSWGKFEQHPHEPQTPSSPVPRRKPVPNRWTLHEDLHQPSYQQRHSGEPGAENGYLYEQNGVQATYVQNGVHPGPDRDYAIPDQFSDERDASYVEQYLDQPSTNGYYHDSNGYSCYQREHRNNNDPWCQQPQQYNSYQAYNGQHHYNDDHLDQHRHSYQSDVQGQHRNSYHSEVQDQHRHSYQSDVQAQQLHPYQSDVQAQQLHPYQSDVQAQHPHSYQSDVQAQPRYSYQPYVPSQHHRATSDHNDNSAQFCQSRADELHLDLYSPSPPRPISRSQPHPPQPQIGRYSCGLEYSYDKMSSRFHGSAGIRGANTARGNNIQNDSKKRSSWLNMETYGIDFGDITAMPVPVGGMGPKTMYR